LLKIFGGVDETTIFDYAGGWFSRDFVFAN